MILALIVFVATLVFVIWQPKGLGLGWSASAGAVVSLATGSVTLLALAGFLLYFG